MHSSSQVITTNKLTSSFLQAGCPSCHPANSVEALKGKYHIPWTCLPPSSPGGLPTLSLTTSSSWLPWGRVAMPLVSPLMPVPHLTYSSFTMAAWQVQKRLQSMVSRYNVFSHYFKTHFFIRCFN